MYLRRLEISGFKSFAEKTVLDFPTGVTAVVGPNGSGKSNIADAVKWVLGEQSMKSLRGKKSEDIIFTGSAKKARMSAASVSLYLDNTDKNIPLDFDEVVVTRKLFRDGESEYLMNKSRVRLIDIIDMLTRSGVSQRGYCVINQGMADAILVASPAERMVIFEEATGVRKFQIKKQQTINKLESTKRNLQRVTDLLQEIEPRLASLKRQATKAQRRGEVEIELKSEQEKLFSTIWVSLNESNKKYREEKEQLEKFVADSMREIDEIKSKLANNESNESDYQAKFDAIQNESGKLREVINDLQRNMSIVEGRIQIENEKKEKAENPEFIPINLGYVKEKLSRIISMYERFYSLLEKMTDLKDMESAKKEGMEVRKNVGLLMQEISEGRVNLNDKKIIFDDSILKKYESEKQAMVSQIQEQSRKYDEIKNRISELNRQEQEKRRVFYELERSLRTKQDELGRFKDNLSRISIELAKFEVRKEDLMNETKDELGSTELIEKIQSGAMELKVDGYFNQDESRSKIRRLKVQLEQIGGIDPLIVEEYEETNKRFEFLSAQANDLVQASESLRKVIKELDEKIEKMFKNSFKKINDEFDRYFKIIFGGGKAGLAIKYTDLKEDEVAEEEEAEKMAEESGETEKVNKEQRIGGIEISAVPPGKKISNLSMLSGGERALTSIAILFAIVANNPPPFSILDEIDAALDEANSMRLSSIVKDVSSKTQFVIITHNREMMKQASVLYGITMQDDGVSRIVSLKLDDVKEK